MSNSLIKTLGQLAISGVSRIAKTKKKQKAKPKMVPQLTAQPSSLKARVVRGPASAAMVRKTNTKPGSRIHRENFSVVAMQVIGGYSSGNVGLRNFSSTAASSAIWDLQPINNFNTQQGASFGNTIMSLANAYSKYRLVKLKVSYEGVLPTSSPGSIAIGYVKDAGISGTISYQDTTATTDNVTCPVWCPSASFEVKTLDKDWKYCVVGTATQPEMRMDCPGSIIVGDLALLNFNQVLGVVRLEGIIEFSELYDGPNFQSRTPVVTSSTTHSSPISDTLINSSSPNTSPPTLLYKTPEQEDISSASFICKHCCSEEVKLIK